MKNVKQKIISYYESQKVSEEFIDNLIIKTKKSQRLQWNRWYGIAALLILSIIPLLILYGRHSAVQKAGYEIAYNHLKKSSVVFSTHNFSQLQSNLNSLDFSIKPSKYPENGEYELLGGKYCTLKDQAAAQMKVKNIQTNTMHTLYAAPLNSTLKWIKSDIVESLGVVVMFWSEGSTLFGLTQ